MTTKENLNCEADAFDKQILERISNGHVPDLRRAQHCHYFYNNPWREPEYVRIDFVEQYELIRQTLHTLFPKRKWPLRVLEVGCGPGHFSLEMARDGFDVTGIDLSPECITVAERFAAEDPWNSERGQLQYHCTDFFSYASKPAHAGIYSACVFVGALHHFEDQEAVMQPVVELLEPDGCILAHEPTRDRFTEATAAIVHLIRTLLAAGGGFYHSEPIPTSPDAQADP